MQNQPSSPSGSIIAPAGPAPFTPPAPGQAPLNTGASLTSQHMAVPEARNSHSIIETIILIVVTIVTIIFVFLYVNQKGEYDAISAEVDSRIDAAVAIAVADNTTKMETEFAEREKYPYREFVGPADYGSLGFSYPRTWSVYIARDAANGGDFEAYLNPTEVQPVSSKTINALRVTIRDTAFDSAIRTYESLVKSQKVQFTTRTVGGLLANLYVGSLPNGIEGAVVVFKLRDKTVMLQTDAELFITEFYKILDTVTLNP